MYSLIFFIYINIIICKLFVSYTSMTIKIYMLIDIVFNKRMYLSCVNYKTNTTTNNNNPYCKYTLMDVLDKFYCQVRK